MYNIQPKRANNQYKLNKAMKNGFPIGLMDTVCVPPILHIVPVYIQYQA